MILKSSACKEKYTIEKIKDSIKNVILNTLPAHKVVFLTKTALCTTLIRSLILNFEIYTFDEKRHIIKRYSLKSFTTGSQMTIRR